LNKSELDTLTQTQTESDSSVANIRVSGQVTDQKGTSIVQFVCYLARSNKLFHP